MRSATRESFRIVGTGVILFILKISLTDAFVDRYCFLRMLTLKQCDKVCFVIEAVFHLLHCFRIQMNNWKCHSYIIVGLGRAIALIALTGSLTACVVPQDTVLRAAEQLPVPEQVTCAASGGTWDASNAKLTKGYCAKGSPGQCLAHGGTWQRVCMMGTLACVQGYPDVQKTCRSGSDCQGQRCLQVPEARANKQPQSGRCIVNNNPCYGGINLENGLPVPTAQAD
jgi:hypothetical protein